MSTRTWSGVLIASAALILAGCPDKKEPLEPQQSTAKPTDDKASGEPAALAAEAAALLDQAIAAAGGEEKIKNLEQFTSLSKGTYLGMPYTATNTFIPGEMRMDVDMPDGSRMAMVMGLQNCWNRTGLVVVACPKGDRESVRQQALFEKAAWLLPIKKGAFEAKATEVTIAGKAHPALEVSGGGLAAPGQLAFDPDTHLLVQTSFEGTMNGARGTFVSTLSAHKEFCGAQHASVYSMSFGGRQIMDETITQLNCGPVDANLFIQPLQVADGTTLEKTTGAATMACTTMKGDYSGLGKAIGELMGFLGKNDLAPMGPPTMIYQKAPPEAKTPADYVTDVCMPVGASSPPAPKEDGAFAIKAMAPTKVLAVYGLGDYGKKSGELAQKLMEELSKRKLAPAGAMRQVTFMNPMDVPPAELVSEMQVPIE